MGVSLVLVLAICCTIFQVSFAEYCSEHLSEIPNLATSQKVNETPVDEEGAFKIPIDTRPGDEVTFTTIYDRPVNVRRVNVNVNGEGTEDTFTIQVKDVDGEYSTPYTGDLQDINSWLETNKADDVKELTVKTVYEAISGVNEPQTYNIAYEGCVPPLKTCQLEAIERLVTFPVCVDSFKITYNRCKGYCDSYSDFRLSSDGDGVLEDVACKCCKPAVVENKTMYKLCPHNLADTYDIVLNYQTAVRCQCEMCYGTHVP